MKNLPLGTLALIVVGASGRTTDAGWSGLDQEIESLTASLQDKAPAGPKVGGYVIASLDYESNPPVLGDDPDTAGTETAYEEDDTLGWRFRYLRLTVSGDLGNDYSYFVSFDLSTGEAAYRDAYVDWKISDTVTGRWGRYKVPFVRSAMLPDSKMLFLQRTKIASRFVGRDIGFTVSGVLDNVNFFVNAQNGSDGIAEDMFYNARLSFDVLGDGVAMMEGAYGAGDSLDLVVGAAIGDDSGLDDGQVWAGEAALTSGAFALAAEIVDFGEDIGDNTPWDATASFLFSDVYEVAARYEDYDSVDDEVAYSLGVNRYVAGHAIKWTLQYQHLDSDLEEAGVSFDRDQAALGLTVAF